MSNAFAAKLALVLKILSMTRSQLAAELQIEKTTAGRWVSGASLPSAHSLSQLTAMIARRVAGFSILDWDRDIDSLAARLGADPIPPAGFDRFSSTTGLPLNSLPQMLVTTALRGAASEGFFRSTRLFAQYPGMLIHDHSMIRMDENGLLRMLMGTAGVYSDAWLLPLHNQLYCIGTERATGTPVFGIFHGTGGIKANVLDGLTLTSIHDVGRTPTAAPIVSERIADLSGDREKDNRFFEELALREPVAPMDSIPKALLDHLCRDIGPIQAALGGEWLMQMPLSRSMTL